MSGDFHFRGDSQPTKSGQQPQILVKVSIRELCDSKLFCFYASDYTGITMS